MTPTYRPSLPPLKTVIVQHRLSSKRSLGQHFLLDKNLINRIVGEVGCVHNQYIFEIGPGPGGLTRALLTLEAKKIIAIEHDQRCIEALRELQNIYPAKLELVHRDALEVDISSFIPQGEKGIIVSNLPYNIATPLLINWLRTIANIKSMVLMFQKEVADRIVGRSGTHSYGRLSVLCQWLCETKKLFDISPNAFTPPPKVTSTLVRLTPKSCRFTQTEFSAVEAVTAAAFGQRRKMLRSSLKQLTPKPKDMLAEANIPPEKRAEELSVAEFFKLAKIHQRTLINCSES